MCVFSGKIRSGSFSVCLFTADRSVCCIDSGIRSTRFRTVVTCCPEQRNLRDWMDTHTQTNTHTHTHTHTHTMSQRRCVFHVDFCLCFCWSPEKHPKTVCMCVCVCVSVYWLSPDGRVWEKFKSTLNIEHNKTMTLYMWLLKGRRLTHVRSYWCNNPSCSYWDPVWVMAVTLYSKLKHLFKRGNKLNIQT